MSVFGGRAGSDSDGRRRSTWAQPPPASSSLWPSSPSPKSQDASDVRTGSRPAAPRRGAEPARDPGAPLGPAESGSWESSDQALPAALQATPDVERVALEHVEGGKLILSIPRPPPTLFFLKSSIDFFFSC